MYVEVLWEKIISVSNTSGPRVQTGLLMFFSPKGSMVAS